MNANGVLEDQTTQIQLTEDLETYASPTVLYGTCSGGGGGTTCCGGQR
jgi:hypothetical protein